MAPQAHRPQAFNFSFFLFGHYAYAGTFATYAALFFAARGMRVAEIGVLLSLIQVMRIFGPNVWGWVADHTSARARVLRLTAGAALLCFGAMFFSQTFIQFFAAMVIVNLFTSAQAPLSEALMLSDMRGDLGKYGRIRLWGSIGFIVAVVAGGYVLDWFGTESLLWYCGALLLLVLGASLRIRELPHEHHAQAAPPLWCVLRKPEVAAFFLSTALMVGAHMALYAFYSLYLARAGYGKPVIGAMWALGVVAEVVFFYFQGRVFGRFSARRVMLWAFAIAVLRFVVTGALPQVFLVLVVAQLMHAATFAAHHSAAVMTMQRWFTGALAARGQALYISLSYGVGGTLGGLGMTWVWERFGPQQMYYGAALMALAGAGVAQYAMHARHERSAA
ncbi:MFS transporter [Massilia sp. CF038]|uniref:MFS transporter n=1 Tax=Massilia sp. CF038 TaxID=1881045 RepID=UPI000915A6CF|nr:MFS transporter [Massilia sp. CF038]SHG95843.1 MFS transporter, PPP family, 3-phenylpropionic acid transporter [Massilia sp. CF038]